MADLNLILRDAEDKDIGSIMELENGSIEHPWNEDAIGSLIEDKNKLCLVIESEGKILCYVGAETVLDECNIGNIVTEKTHRGLGLGTKMMTELLKELASRGICKVFLEVESGNAPAIALYEKHGFVRYGLRRGYYGPGKDAVLMTKDL